MVVVILRLVVPALRRDETLRAIQAVIGPLQVALGCLSCHLYQDTANPNAFGLVEQWQSQVALERHVRSALYTRLLAVMESAQEAPDIAFYWVNQSMGWRPFIP